jgi:hypothetical protein
MVKIPMEQIETETVLALISFKGAETSNRQFIIINSLFIIISDRAYSEPQKFVVKPIWW